MGIIEKLSKKILGDDEDSRFMSFLKRLSGCKGEEEYVEEEPC